MSLVGRDDEVRAVSALLERPDVRLLTLTGPAGIGKTRLALAAAAALAPAFADGVFALELAESTKPELLGAAIARAIGLEGTLARRMPKLCWKPCGPAHCCCSSTALNTPSRLRRYWPRYLPQRRG